MLDCLTSDMGYAFTPLILHEIFALPQSSNLITLGRLGLVPAIISMIAAQRWQAACVLFILAGVSDALDGWIAKTFDLRTQLGAYLDPLADKALIVSIYVALAIVGVVPATIAIIVVARDDDRRGLHDLLGS